MIIDKIYIINLERAKERLNKVVSELEKIGGQFSNYTIFKAVDGKTIKNDEIKTKYCAKNNILLIRIKYDQNIEETLKQKLKLNYEKHVDQ